jgi:tripartite-type tricarboxylate transporter receptor subunit TctC
LDIGIRIIQARLSAALGTPLAIVNRPGASGVVGMSAVLGAEADGYTLGASSTSTLTVVQLTSESLPYRTAAFVPLGNYAADAGVVVVHADSPWKTIDDLITYARANPGKLTYGSYGGSLSSLNMEALKVAYGVDMLSVPYPGAPQANLAVVSKQVDIGASPFSAVRGQISNGVLRALLSTSDTRVHPLADVPTATEKGVRQANLKLTLGLYAKAGTPSAMAERLEQALKAAVHDSTVSAALEKAGLFPRYVDARTARAELEAEERDVLDLGRKLNMDPKRTK